MKEMTNTQPMTDAEYEAEADRYLEAIRGNLRAMQESRQRNENIHAETQAGLKNVFETLQRMSASRAA